MTERPPIVLDLDCVLRVATVAEAEQIRDLMALVLAKSLDDEAVRADTIANVNRNVAFWLANPEKCVHIVAAMPGTIVGVVLVKEFWNLCSLFVDPKHQRSGIGRALVNAAAAACRGRSPRQALWLNAATNAIGFYTHLGFEKRESRQPLPAGFMAMQLPL
jgi:GNAT superfamily N-acetyltransferase